MSPAVSFPAQSELQRSQKSKIFNVSPLLWNVYDHGNNNCTSILGGTNALTQPKSGKTYWLLGQPFFAGHYVDFDTTAKTISFGDLKDPSMESSA
jgi:pepsin A